VTEKQENIGTKIKRTIERKHQINSRNKKQTIVIAIVKEIKNIIIVIVNVRNYKTRRVRFYLKVETRIVVILKKIVMEILVLVLVLVVIVVKVVVVVVVVAVVEVVVVVVAVIVVVAVVVVVVVVAVIVVVAVVAVVVVVVVVVVTSFRGVDRFGDLILLFLISPPAILESNSNIVHPSTFCKISHYSTTGFISPKVSWSFFKMIQPNLQLVGIIHFQNTSALTISDSALKFIADLPISRLFI